MTRLSDSLPGRQTGPKGPTTPYAQRLPACTRARFGLIRFRSPLLTEYLFLPVLRCFTSRRSLHTPYTFRCGSYHMTGTGFPHSEILGSRFVCQLPEAYRRLPRPSSAPGAKASTLCPYKLQPQKTKMLASTVQFSNNDQAHHQHPTPTHPNPAAEAGCTGPAALRPTPGTTHPTRARGLPETIRRTSHPTAAVPSGPNSVSCAGTVPDPPRSHPAKPGVLGARSGCLPAVIDVPP